MTSEAQSNIKELKILEERLGNILAETGGVNKFSKISARVQGNGINRGSGGNRNLPEGERYVYNVAQGYDFKEFLKLFISNQKTPQYSGAKKDNFKRFETALAQKKYDPKQLKEIYNKTKSIGEVNFKSNKLNLLSELHSVFLELESEQNAQITTSFKEIKLKHDTKHNKAPEIKPALKKEIKKTYYPEERRVRFSDSVEFHDKESQEKLAKSQTQNQPSNFWDNLGYVFNLPNSTVEKQTEPSNFWDLGNFNALFTPHESRNIKQETPLKPWEIKLEEPKDKPKNLLENFDQILHPLLNSALNLFNLDENQSIDKNNVPLPIPNDMSNQGLFLANTSLKPKPSLPEKVQSVPVKVQSQGKTTSKLSQSYLSPDFFFEEMKEKEKKNSLDSSSFVERKSEYLNERKIFWNTYLEKFGIEAESNPKLYYGGIADRAKEYLLYLNRNIEKINIEIAKGEQAKNLQILLAFHQLEIEKVQLMFKDDPRKMFNFPNHAQMGELKYPNKIKHHKLSSDSRHPRNMKDSPYVLGFVPDSYPDQYTFNSQQEGSQSYRQYMTEKRQLIIQKINSLPSGYSISYIEFPGAITEQDFNSSKKDKEFSYKPNNITFQNIIKNATKGMEYQHYTPSYPSYLNSQMPSTSPKTKKIKLTDEQELILKEFKSEACYIQDIEENTSGVADFENIESRMRGIEKALGVKLETYKNKFKEDKKQISQDDNLKYAKGKCYTDKGKNVYAYLCFLERKMKSIRIVRGFLENDNEKESCIEKTKEVEAHLLLEVVKIKNGITSNQEINREVYLSENTNKTTLILQERVRKAIKSMGVLFGFVSKKIEREIRNNTIGELDQDIPGAVHKAPLARNTSRHDTVANIGSRWKELSLGQYGNITDLKIELNSLKNPLKTKLKEILKESKKSEKSTHQKVKRLTTNPLPYMRPDTSKVSSFNNLTLGSIF